MPVFEILRKKLWLAVASALLAFALSYYLMVFNVTGGSISIYADMNGVWYTVLTLGMSAIISVLFGVWIASVAFTSKPGLSGFLGTLVGAAATGCPTCGAPLLAVVGMPLGLFRLPFWGLELKAASIILMSVSIFFMLKPLKGCKLR